MRLSDFIYFYVLCACGWTAIWYAALPNAPFWRKLLGIVGCVLVSVALMLLITFTLFLLLITLRLA